MSHNQLIADDERWAKKIFERFTMYSIWSAHTNALLHKSFKREPREMQTHSASCTWCQAAKLSHLFSTVYTLFIVKHDEHNYNRPDCRLEDEKKTQRILCLVSNRLSWENFWNFLFEINHRKKCSIASVDFGWTFASMSNCVENMSIETLMRIDFSVSFTWYGYWILFKFHQA